MNGDRRSNIGGLVEGTNKEGDGAPQGGARGEGGGRVGVGEGGQSAGRLWRRETDLQAAEEDKRGGQGGGPEGGWQRG